MGNFTRNGQRGYPVPLAIHLSVLFFLPEFDTLRGNENGE